MDTLPSNCCASEFAALDAFPGLPAGQLMVGGWSPMGHPREMSRCVRKISHKSTARQRRYDAVHLRTPPLASGYNHQNPLGIESAAEAAAIDDRIDQRVGRPFPASCGRTDPGFFAKAQSTPEILRAEMPACCRTILFRVSETTTAAPMSSKADQRRAHVAARKRKRVCQDKRPSSSCSLVCSVAVR